MRVGLIVVVVGLVLMSLFAYQKVLEPPMVIREAGLGDPDVRISDAHRRIDILQHEIGAYRWRMFVALAAASVCCLAFYQSQTRMDDLARRMRILIRDRMVFVPPPLSQQQPRCPQVERSDEDDDGDQEPQAQWRAPVGMELEES